MRFRIYIGLLALLLLNFPLLADAQQRHADTTPVKQTYFDAPPALPYLLPTLSSGPYTCEQMSDEERNEATQVSEGAANDYKRALYQQLNENWPGTASDSPMFLLTVIRNGTLREVRLLKSSGSSEHDQIVAAAIRKAFPFNELPNKYVSLTFPVHKEIIAPSEPPLSAEQEHAYTQWRYKVTNAIMKDWHPTFYHANYVMAARILVDPRSGDIVTLRFKQHACDTNANETFYKAVQKNRFKSVPQALKLRPILALDISFKYSIHKPSSNPHNRNTDVNATIK